ncbi:MAG: VWA domain-containing protein [Acidimicrobiia bacterium]
MVLHSEQRRSKPGGPLARKPKQLDAEPARFQRGSNGMVLKAGDGEPGDGPPPPTKSGHEVTDERGEVRSLDEILGEHNADPAVKAAAKQIAALLGLKRQRNLRHAKRGPGRAISLPYRFDADEIDLDRTLEILAERPFPEPEDIIVRSRVRTRRAVALIVDVSGSMKGEKAKVAAATVGALAGELHREELTIVAFWKDCAILHTPRQRLDPGQVLDDLLRLPAKGLTNVSAGLQVAAEELARSSARQRIAVLLSDCVHNAGEDPRLISARLPRLHVMLQNDGEHDAWLAGELARTGGGLLASVRTARDVAPALNRLLAD